MPVVHLTDIVVSRLKAPGIYYDETTPAFGVRIGKHRKAWIITRGTQRQRITIGQYPRMSLAEARKEAKKQLSQEPAQGTKIKFGEVRPLEGRHRQQEASYPGRLQADDREVSFAFEKKKLSDIAYEDIAAITDPLARCQGGHCLAVGRAFFR
jgi:hypothetical protein